MRNRFAGTCYRCGYHVPPGAGHFERYRATWRVQHAECALWWRNQYPTREEGARRYEEAQRRKKA